jgi:hypothetical protein
LQKISNVLLYKLDLKYFDLKTQGVESVGIVKAVEILNEFEGDDFEKLKNFK